MAEFVKSFFDSLDKVTDILNVGRLVFYTSAGFAVVLPGAMSLRLFGQAALQAAYWRQFSTDLVACAKSPEIWMASLVLGFVVANLGNALVMRRFTPPPRREIKPDFYSYQYPRLFSGGIPPKDGTGKDYAAWLVSEYYRYVEIAVFIPYGVLLSLPVYSFYTLLYLLLQTPPPGVSLNAGHYGFAIWTAAAAFCWTVAWPGFWIPRVAEPVYQDWVNARRAGIQGLIDFIGKPEASVGAPGKPDASANKTAQPETSGSKTTK